MSSVVPNNGPFPSSIEDSPYYAAALGIPQGFAFNIGSVPEEAAVANMATGEQYTPQGARNMLAETRSKFPYLAIAPVPSFMKTLYMTSGVAKDFNFPVGLVTARFSSSAPALICFNGNAQLPASTDKDESFTILIPQNETFYVGNLRSVSVIAPDTGCIISVYGHRFEEMPRHG